MKKQSRTIYIKSIVSVALMLLSLCIVAQETHDFKFNLGDGTQTTATVTYNIDTNPKRLGANTYEITQDNLDGDILVVIISNLQWFGSNISTDFSLLLSSPIDKDDTLHEGDEAVLEARVLIGKQGNTTIRAILEKANGIRFNTTSPLIIKYRPKSTESSISTTPISDISKPNPRPKRPTTPSSPQQSEEESAWEDVNKSDVSSLKSFLRKYPDSELEAKVNQLIAQNSALRQNSFREIEPSTYEFEYANALSRLDVVVVGEEYGIIEVLNNDWNSRTFVASGIFRVTDAGNHSIYFRDRKKILNLQKTTEIELNNLMKATAKKTENNIQIDIEKGEKPFTIYYKKQKESTLKKLKEGLEDRKLEYTIADLQTAILQADPTANGIYVFALKDKAKVFTVLIEIKDSKNMLEIKVAPKENPYLLWAAAGVFGLVAIVLFSRMSKRRQREKKQEEFEQIKQQRALEEHESPKPKIATATPNIRPIVVSSETTQKIDIPVRKKSIKIQKKQPEKGLSSDFLPYRQNRDYYAFNMRDTWEDSIVETVYMKHDCIQLLNQFLVSKNTAMIPEKEGDIPEIGGMLLGLYKLDEKRGLYDVSIEKFVPIESRRDSVYELEFSIESLAVELSKIQDENKHLKLVGWFHTHPGHKLFLSKSDLRIQNGFFRAPYQFAMEIDSLTKRLDTGFFTWKRDKIINNITNLAQVKRWFSWKEIREDVFR